MEYGKPALVLTICGPSCDVRFTLRTDIRGPSMPSKPSAIPLGTRIKMSELGAARCPRIAEKRGMVISGSRNPNTVWVRFDGNMSPTSLHRDYVEPIEATENTEG